jgi:hypothetical protein
VQAANAAVRKKDSYYKAKYNKLRFQLGSANKAKVAIANRIARTIYHLIKKPELAFHDLGQLRVESPEKRINRLIGQLKSMGVTVEYYPHQKIVEAKKETVIPR